MFIVAAIVFSFGVSTALGGDCNAINPSYTRYYYDGKSEKCTKFTLTHAPPTSPTNIFDDSVVCEARCGKVIEDRCKPSSSLSKMTQKSATQTAYAYQKDAFNNEQCVPITPFSTYETFPTNYNAFEKIDQCKKACLKSGQCTSPLPPKVTKYYFNGQQCERIEATVSSLPGSNLFDTLEQCSQACFKSPQARCTPNPAYLVDGTSRSLYAFDPKKKCSLKTYVGYPTLPQNINFFATRRDCIRACGATGRSPACNLDVAAKTSYFFDGTKCQAVTLTVPVYSTSNAFNSKDDCEKNCVPPPEPRCKPTAKDKKVDSSSINVQYYTYDVVTTSCKVVPYSGYITIPSGLNLYKSSADCEAACGKEARCSIPDPPLNGGKYYYDPKSKGCSQVDLRVPLLSDSNVFDSEQECFDNCDPNPSPECIITDPNKKATVDSVKSKLYTYDSKSNTCKKTTYSGVINPPPKSNFFNNADECERMCVKSTTTLLSTVTVPGQTPAPNTSPGPSLPDTDGRCCAWAAIGECERNGPWMKSQCQVSCGTPTATRYTANKIPSKPPPNCVLPATPVTQGACKDLDVRCWAWRRLGECLKNAPYMQTRCSATCNYCNVKPEDFYPSCKKDAGTCKNQNEFCCYWADPAQGECTKNPAFMDANCPAACGTCAKAAAAAAASSASNSASSSNSALKIQATVISGGGLTGTGFGSQLGGSGLGNNFLLAGRRK